MSFLKNALRRIGYLLAGIISLLIGLIIFLDDPKFRSLFEEWYRNPFVYFFIGICCLIISFSPKKKDSIKKEEVPVEKKNESENRPG